MNKQIIILLISIILNFSILLSASDDGDYFIQNFSYSDYEGNNQIFESIQDERGILYFANTDLGVLEYDGNSWRHLELENFSSGRCLAKSDDGTIFVGGVSDFGYIKTDKLQSSYISLLPKVPKNDRHFEYVWECEANKNGVYFNTDNTIYLYDGDSIKTITTDTGFHVLRESNGRIFVRVIDKGLFEIDGTILKLLKDGEKFAKNTINAVIAKDNGDLVIFSRDSGMYNYDGDKFTKVELKNSSRLYKSLIYDALIIGEDRFAVATKNGIFIIDNNKVKQHLDINVGLINNIVLDLFLDKEKNLWVSTNGGISKINLYNDLSYFDEKHNINNSINDIKKFNDKLYVATMTGILVKNGLKFKKIEGIDSGVWKFEILNNKLYIASTQGLYYLDDGKIYKENSMPDGVVSMSKDEKENLYISQSNKISVIKKYSNTSSKIIDLQYRPTTMIHENNYLWFTNDKKELFHIYLLKNKTTYTKKDFTSFLEGKNKQSFFMKKIDSTLYFSIDNQLYTFDYEKNDFIKSSILSDNITSLDVKDIISYEKKTWLTLGKSLVTAQLLDKKILKYYPFSYFKGRKIITVEKDNDGSFWFGGADGLIHYNPKEQYQKPQNSILIRSLIINNFKNKELNNISYTGDSFSMDVALNSYSFTGENRYKFELNGAYTIKQDYSKNNNFSIYNLPHGYYKLIIYAQNIFKDETKRIISFSVLTPWYLTKTAYFMYLLLILFLIYISGKIQSHYQNTKQKQKLNEEIKQRHILENKVKERTKELYHKNKLLEELAIRDKLTKLYNRVKLDDVFENELNRSNRYDASFSIILIDIDFFKLVNDNYGHQVGDNILIEFANILKFSIRDVDILGRWGGEEFLIICPDTDSHGAITLAEHIRVKIDNFSFHIVNKKTASFGVSSFIQNDTQETILSRADNGLYKAKESGRNQVVYTP